MRKVFAVVLSVALIVAAMPVPAGAAVRGKQAVQSQGGSVQGTARNAQQQPLANVTVQLRNVQTGQIAATGTTSAAGQFSFTNIPAGSYIVEVVDSRGAIVAATAPFAVNAGQVAAVTVTGSAAGALAGGAGGGLFGMGTTGTIVLVAGAAGAIGIGIAIKKHNEDKSPKK